MKLRTVYYSALIISFIAIMCIGAKDDSYSYYRESANFDGTHYECVTKKTVTVIANSDKYENGTYSVFVQDCYGDVYSYYSDCTEKVGTQIKAIFDADNSIIDAEEE